MAKSTRSRTWLRRMLRFSLFSFLLAVTLVAGVLGWIRHRAEKQRLAVEWILSQGGNIRYERYRRLQTNVYYMAGSPEDKAQRAALRPENSWLADMLGEHYVHRIERILFHESKLKGEVWRLKYAYGAKKLCFEECDLSTDVLEALSRCKSVEEIGVWDCRCDQAGLRFLAELPKLRRLYMHKVALNDVALEHLGKCRNLESLDLTYCRFPAEDVEKLRALSKLTHCGLGFTSVADRQLGVVASWPDLKTLDLGERVTDAGLDHLTSLTDLETLTFMKSAVTDEGILKLVKLPKLKSLQLSDCRLSDELIYRLSNEDPHWTISYVR
jgi:hypothetical protein